MEENEIQISLERSFDDLLFQFSKGVTIEMLEKKIRYEQLEQVKEWKSKFGYQFHIYSNDHFIDNKPHFHLVKRSQGIDCRLFFDGVVYDCKGQNSVDKKTLEAVKYFLAGMGMIKKLVEFWNLKNPEFKIE